MKTGADDFDRLMEVLDLPHRYGTYLSSRCPFHDDQRPSFFVYADYYKCLACGAHGATNKLLEHLGKRAPVLRQRAESQGPANPFSLWAKERTLRKTLHVAWQTINRNPGMGRYITVDRGIDEPYRKLLGIGYIDDWYTIPLTNRDGIIISAIARKGRDNRSLHKYVLPFGTNPNLLYVPNWSKVRDARFLVLTFGILDAVVLAMLGIPAASTISGKRLSKVALSAFRCPILVLADRKEEADGLNLVNELGWRGRFISTVWPEQCKDLNEIWVRDRAMCRDFVFSLVAQLGVPV